MARWRQRERDVVSHIARRRRPHRYQHLLINHADTRRTNDWTSGGQLHHPARHDAGVHDYRVGLPGPQPVAINDVCVQRRARAAELVGAYGNSDVQHATKPYADRDRPVGPGVRNADVQELHQEHLRDDYGHMARIGRRHELQGVPLDQLHSLCQ